MSARRIFRICKRSLGMSGWRAATAGTGRSASEASAVGELVVRSAEDAERAFADLVGYLSHIICDDDSLFDECTSNLLNGLLPADADGWRVLTSVLRNRAPYKWTLADERIAADAALLEFLGELPPDTYGLSDDDIDRWINAALRKIYEKTGPA